MFWTFPCSNLSMPTLGHHRIEAAAQAYHTLSFWLLHVILPDGSSILLEAIAKNIRKPKQITAKKAAPPKTSNRDETNPKPKPVSIVAPFSPRDWNESSVALTDEPFDDISRYKAMEEPKSVKLPDVRRIVIIHYWAPFTSAVDQLPKMEEPGR